MWVGNVITLATKNGTNYLTIDGLKIELKYPTIKQDQYLQSILFGDDYNGKDIALKYFQYYIKFTIKSWNYTEPIKLIKNDMGEEVEDELWWRIVSDPVQALDLGGRIMNVLSLTDEDKKK